MKGSFFLSASALWRREMVRFIRQRSRIIGAFASPLIFWLLLGANGFFFGQEKLLVGASVCKRFDKLGFSLG